ncbi:hypothetical protein E4K72_19755 [Oxalobacteraceae bacterium OM1]|nr:hypothetical protein E4K72_19755 [Oxalobacteraceae bacterium OM1]
MYSDKKYEVRGMTASRTEVVVLLIVTDKEYLIPARQLIALAKPGITAPAVPAEETKLVNAPRSSQSRCNAMNTIVTCIDGTDLVAMHGSTPGRRLNANELFDLADKLRRAGDRQHEADQLAKIVLGRLYYFRGGNPRHFLAVAGARGTELKLADKAGNVLHNESVVVYPVENLMEVSSRPAALIA